MTWELRPAVPGDVTDLAAMIRALAEYEKLAHLVVADEAMLAVSLFGERPAAEAIIAREGHEGGAAAGFALFFHTFSTFLGRRGLWLEDLFVYPRFRGRGLGRALIGRVGALARERGCGRFEWSVLNWNADAIRFYENLGATLLPDWRIARVTGDALTRFALPAEPA
ncbi:MAG: GNAT family N-acetyltransferase [Burkholderiales bacterium]